MAKLALLLIAALSFSSCINFEPYYDKEFYERISGIKFPKKATAIESVDNGEFVTMTVFNVDTNSLQQFISSYKFNKAGKSDLVNSPYIKALWNSYLTDNKPDFSTINKLYYKSDSKGKIPGYTWLTLVVKNSGRKFNILIGQEINM